VESLHKAGVLLALDGLHPGTGPPFRRHGSDDEYREVGISSGNQALARSAFIDTNPTDEPITT
jgi:hypothetical protein